MRSGPQDLTGAVERLTPERREALMQIAECNWSQSGILRSLASGLLAYEAALSDIEAERSALLTRLEKAEGELAGWMGIEAVIAGHVARANRAEFLLAIVAATFDGPHGWWETRRLWHSAVQDNYENAYVEQTVADAWRKAAAEALDRATQAEARADRAEAELVRLAQQIIDTQDEGDEVGLVAEAHRLLAPEPPRQDMEGTP